jgi:hypothetical protein
MYIPGLKGKVCLGVLREPISYRGSDVWDNLREVLPFSVNYVPFLIRSREQGISMVKEAAARL